jgi:hypothetical protein
VIGYLGVMSYANARPYYHLQLWSPHVVKLLEAALVLAMAGWLANRKIEAVKEAVKSNPIRTILRMARLAFLSIGLLIAVEVGFHFAIAWHRNGLLFYGRFDDKYRFLTQHIHSVPPSESQPQALVARLTANTISLETISERAARDITCWYPDGTIRCRQTEKPSGSAAFRAGHRELFFCVASTGDAVNLGRLHWECLVGNQGIEQACFGYELPWKTRIADVKAIEFDVPFAAASARLRLGIPIGSWEDTDAVWLWKGDPQAPRKKAISHSGEDWEFSFAGISDTANSAHSSPGLDVNYTMPVKRDADARLIAIDTEGKRHEPQMASGQSEFPWRGNKIGQIEFGAAFFPNMKLPQLKELRFQICHYSWVEFANVSLKPAQHTQVEVKDATISPSPEK